MMLLEHVLRSRRLVDAVRPEAGFLVAALLATFKIPEMTKMTQILQEIPVFLLYLIHVAQNYNKCLLVLIHQ